MEAVSANGLPGDLTDHPIVMAGWGKKENWT
jgi:hypothetical protein